MTTPAQADTIFVNAAVYTVDESLPRADSVAVAGNHIVYVGDRDGALALRGSRTEVIDCGGRSLLPGFIDSHFHLLYGSLKLDHLQLDEVHTRDEIAAAIRDFAGANPELEWIEGVQLRYSALGHGDGRFDRHFLDALVADRPVVVTAYDGHTVWANTEALRRGGVLHGRALPPGNEIVMEDGTGMASGELREPAAFEPIRGLIPDPDDVARRALLHKGLALCARHGITSVHNMDGNDERLALFAGLEDMGEMTVRVYVPYDVKPETPIEEIARAAEWKRTVQGSHVRTGAIKVFMDGVLESYTALMVDDYAGKPGNKGDSLHSAERFNAIAQYADSLGLQIAVHCCGDGAVRRVLDGYEHAQRVNGRRDSRHRVEHIEVIHPDDIPRFAELGVVASMQPLHSPPHVHAGDVWPARAGEERWPLSFAWETLRQAGAHLAYGSDWPVVGMDPIHGLHAGLNREPWAPGHPEQRQSLENLIAGYTRDAAWVEFMEHEKGMIRRGYLADLVLLSEDVFAVPPEEMLRVRVDLTMCDGRIVFRSV